MDELEFEKDLGDLVERTISSGNPTVQYYLEAIPAIFDYLRLTGRVKTQTDFAKFIGTDASRLSRILNWKQSSKKVLKDPPPVQLYRYCCSQSRRNPRSAPIQYGISRP